VPVTLTLAWTVAFFAFSWFTFPNCECVSCPVWGVCQVGVGALGS
jgi:hypothetical protein